MIAQTKAADKLAGLMGGKVATHPQSTVSNHSQPASRHADKPTSRHADMTTSQVRTVMASARIDATLWKAMKQAALDADKPVQAIVTEAFTNYLATQR